MTRVAPVVVPATGSAWPRTSAGGVGLPVLLAVVVRAAGAGAACVAADERGGVVDVVDGDAVDDAEALDDVGATLDVASALADPAHD